MSFALHKKFNTKFPVCESPRNPCVRRHCSHRLPEQSPRYGVVVLNNYTIPIQRPSRTCYTVNKKSRRQKNKPATKATARLKCMKTISLLPPPPSPNEHCSLIVNDASADRNRTEKEQSRLRYGGISIITTQPLPSGDHFLLR